MWSPLRKVGNTAENIAKKFLQKNQLKLVEANYLSKFGEIDLIMLDTSSNDEILVFIEVRFRTSDNFTTSVESIDANKQKKIIKTAQIFLQQNPKYADNVCRFDAVGVENSLKSPVINWIQNAFIL
jgi:putative endonuclease